MNIRLLIESVTSNRVPKLKKHRINEIIASFEENQEIIARGWVRTKRGSKNVTFIHLNDGSCLQNLQIVAEGNLFDETTLKDITTGAAIEVEGTLRTSQGAGQSKELIASKIKILGKADPEEYPIQPKKHSFEFLRENAHLRMRTSTFGAIFRIRHAMSFAVHQFYNDRGFYYFHSPIITGSDCEGAGEMFHVTNFDIAQAPKTEDGNIDYTQDFFAQQTSLTVSGQLEGELGAMALGSIYTFGPTFRAENSNTSRHLAEFWMIEPEVAFNDLRDNMDLAEEFMKYLVTSALNNCAEDLEFLHQRELDAEKTLPKEKRNEFPLIDRLKLIVENDFERLTYTDAIRILKESKPYKKGKFEYDVDWGIDLQSEHERYLVEKKFKKPVILTDYPKEIKAFYMKLNDDNKTVAAMDVLFPGIGEIIGGSERETDYNNLVTRMTDYGINPDDLKWYLDSRRFGSAPHAGFGLGFERLMLFVTGMTNIRDVIPFPRTPGNAEF